LGAAPLNTPMPLAEEGWLYMDICAWVPEFLVIWQNN